MCCRNSKVGEEQLTRSASLYRIAFSSCFNILCNFVANRQRVSFELEHNIRLTSYFLQNTTLLPRTYNNIYKTKKKKIQVNRKSCKFSHQVFLISQLTKLIASLQRCASRTKSLQNYRSLKLIVCLSSINRYCFGLFNF